jgi:hypothetical protein
VPRTLAKIRKRQADARGRLDFELELSLVYGQGIIGTSLDLRTLEDWEAAWEQWRDIVEPKVAEHRPGTRAFAAYVVGEIPEREILVPPPLSNGYFKLYVPARTREGRWHYRYPPPYMIPEERHLAALGIVDDAELARCRAWRKQRTKDCPTRCQAETYPLEHEHE